MLKYAQGFILQWLSMAIDLNELLKQHFSPYTKCINNGCINRSYWFSNVSGFNDYKTRHHVDEEKAGIRLWNQTAGKVLWFVCFVTISAIHFLVQAAIPRLMLGWWRPFNVKIRTGTQFVLVHCFKVWKNPVENENKCQRYPIHSIHFKLCCIKNTM